MNGRLDFSGSWVVSDLRPHISMRFKDVMRGIPLGTTPPFVIADRPDRAFDLEWFMSRYPLEMTPAAEQRLNSQVSTYKAQIDDIRALQRPDYKPSSHHGFKSPEAPMPYQSRAAELFRKTGRLLLLDDVGLGKTVSALAAIADGWGLPAAVVVQPHLSGQWANNFIKRFTNLTVHEVKDRKVRSLPPADVYVFRYSNIAAWADYAETLRCKTLIFDEIQDLRHGESTDKGRGAAAFVRSAEHVMGLTATPIYNYGSEIFNVVEMIAPGVLGNWYEFIINWCKPHGSHLLVKDPQALGAYLQDEGLAIRRTTADAEVASTLPKLSKVVIEVDWDDGAVQTDRELQKKLANRILYGRFTESGQAARALDLLLRQETGIAKARSVAAYVRTLVEADEPVLLVGWHREVYKCWLERLDDLSPVMFTGSESQAAKTRARNAFVSGDTNLMIMSLRSGAGLDGLQARGRHVVFGELDWSPQVHTQVVGRLHRAGQQSPVAAHYLHVEGGSDPVLMSTLGIKASQSHGLLNPFVSAPDATPVDETRMRQLAKLVLEDQT